jgi:hypothetical protein
MNDLRASIGIPATAALDTESAIRRSAIMPGNHGQLSCPDIHGAHHRLCAASALDAHGGLDHPYLDGPARHMRDHLSVSASRCPAPGVLGVLVRRLCVPESVRVGPQPHSEIA